MRNFICIIILVTLSLTFCEQIPLPEIVPDELPAISNELTGKIWKRVSINGLEASDGSVTYLQFTSNEIIENGIRLGNEMIYSTYDASCNLIEDDGETQIFFFTKKNLNALHESYWLTFDTKSSRFHYVKTFGGLNVPQDESTFFNSAIFYNFSIKGDSLMLTSPESEDVQQKIVYVSVPSIDCSSCPEVLDCQNGGTFNYNDCACECPEGWTGPNCETPIEDNGNCDIPCENGRIVSYDGCECECEEGWTGEACDEQIAVLQDAPFNIDFEQPAGISTDIQFNTYITDIGNQNIYKVTVQGSVSIIASAQDGLNEPMHAVADGNGNVYIADQGNHQIWFLPYQGELSVYAGTGEGFADGNALSEAKFHNPYALALDIPKNRLYVADATNARIRTITLSQDSASRTVSTLAGSGNFEMIDGTGTEAGIGNPAGLAYAPNEDLLYFTDWYNHAVRSVHVLTGEVNTLVAPELNVAANLSPANPAGITIGRNGSLYFADHNNHVVRRIDQHENFISVEELVGFYDIPGNENGSGTASRLNSPFGVQFTQALDPPNSYFVLYVADMGNAQVKMVRFEQ